MQHGVVCMQLDLIFFYIQLCTHNHTQHLILRSRVASAIRILDTSIALQQLLGAHLVLYRELNYLLSIVLDLNVTMLNSIE